MAEVARTSVSVTQEARHRARVIEPLAKCSQCPIHLVRKAAAELGLSERYVYKLIKRLRCSNFDASALLPVKTRGGCGQSRLEAACEATIRSVVTEFSSAGKAVQQKGVVWEVIAQCEKRGIKPPSPATVRRRLSNHLNETKPAGTGFADTSPSLASIGGPP